MLLGRGEDVQSRSESGISPSLDIELFPESAKVLRFVIDNWEHPAKKREGCPSVPSRHKYQTASGRLGVECQGPAIGDPHRLAATLLRLPSAGVPTAVRVQHLPGDMTSFRQINHRLSDPKSSP